MEEKRSPRESKGVRVAPAFLYRPLSHASCLHTDHSNVTEKREHVQPFQQMRFHPSGAHGGRPEPTTTKTKTKTKNAGAAKQKKKKKKIITTRQNFERAPTATAIEPTCCNLWACGVGQQVYVCMLYACLYVAERIEGEASKRSVVAAVGCTLVLLNGLV